MTLAPSGRRGGRHKIMFGDSLNYLIDMENAVILDFEATPARISKEVDATEIMVERVEKRFALKRDRIAGDVAYGTGEMPGWLVAREIEPHVPVWDQSEEGFVISAYARDCGARVRFRLVAVAPGAGNTNGVNF